MNNHYTAPEHSSVPYADLKRVVQDYLSRSTHKPSHTPHDPALRARVGKVISGWKVTNLDQGARENMLNACCIYAETAYAHLSHDHRFYVALYSACMLCADDLSTFHADDCEAERAHRDAVTSFGRRFVRGEDQPDDALRCLASLLRDASEYWTQYGADGIVAGTLEALAAMRVESAMEEKRLETSPAAVRYPWYLRTRAGIGAPYTHFMFMKTWRDAPESYVQIIPEIEHWTLGTNDILSFYKEELAGETANYVHLRASADQCSPDHVLHQLVEDVLDTAHRIETIVDNDPDLCALLKRYMQGYLEFTVMTPRYRLAELGINAAMYI